MGEATGHGKALAYRADIDGLRAVAVLSVLAFHMKTQDSPCSGGVCGRGCFFCDLRLSDQLHCLFRDRSAALFSRFLL